MALVCPSGVNRKPQTRVAPASWRFRPLQGGRGRESEWTAIKYVAPFFDLTELRPELAVQRPGFPVQGFGRHMHVPDSLASVHSPPYPFPRMDARAVRPFARRKES